MIAYPGWSVTSSRLAPGLFIVFMCPISIRFVLYIIAITVRVQSVNKIYLTTLRIVTSGGN